MPTNYVPVHVVHHDYRDKAHVFLDRKSLGGGYLAKATVSDFNEYKKSVLSDIGVLPEMDGGFEVNRKNCRAMLEYIDAVLTALAPRLGRLVIRVIRDPAPTYRAARSELAEGHLVGLFHPEDEGFCCGAISLSSTVTYTKSPRKATFNVFSRKITNGRYATVDTRAHLKTSNSMNAAIDVAKAFIRRPTTGEIFEHANAAIISGYGALFYKKQQALNKEARDLFEETKLIPLELFLSANNPLARYNTWRNEYFMKVLRQHAASPEALPGFRMLLDNLDSLAAEYRACRSFTPKSIFIRMVGEDRETAYILDREVSDVPYKTRVDELPDDIKGKIAILNMCVPAKPYDGHDLTEDSIVEGVGARVGDGLFAVFS